jgi:hypothetical protein
VFGSWGTNDTKPPTKEYFMKEITVKKWIALFNCGVYAKGDRETQIKAGWYDWFCKDTSLKNKTLRMGNIIKKITNPKILNDMYVFFKNNCPLCGRLYDQFKFCDLETSEVIYCVSCDDERENHKYTVYGRENGFKEAIASFDTSTALVNWFNDMEAYK